MATSSRAVTGTEIPPHPRTLPLPPPPAFPPWRTVYGYMRAFASAGVWESIRHHLVVMLREREGREPSPTAAIVDTQSVRTTEKGGRAATTPPRR
jgi:transposase